MHTERSGREKKNKKVKKAHTSTLREVRYDYTKNETIP